MIVRLLEWALLAAVLVRFATGRWPWVLWPGLFGLAPDRSVARARALLGVSADAGREAILAAHRRRIAEVHPDRGGSNEAVHEANAARDLLLAALARG